MTQNSTAHRILVVDDELLMRWSVAETLKLHGYTVVEAENGAAAMRVLRDSTHPVDAVVLDYRLPDTSDLSLLSWIRRIAPVTPVILMTVYGSPDLHEGARRLGAYDVIDKPFDLKKLEGVVARACEARRAATPSRPGGTS
jgi:DNA-binding NtrC family response regulator